MALSLLIDELENKNRYSISYAEELLYNLDYYLRKRETPNKLILLKYKKRLLDYINKIEEK